MSFASSEAVSDARAAFAASREAGAAASATGTGGSTASLAEATASPSGTATPRTGTSAGVDTFSACRSASSSLLDEIRASLAESSVLLKGVPVFPVGNSARLDENRAILVEFALLALNVRSGCGADCVRRLPACGYRRIASAPVSRRPDTRLAIRACGLTVCAAMASVVLLEPVEEWARPCVFAGGTGEPLAEVTPSAASTRTMNTVRDIRRMRRIESLFSVDASPAVFKVPARVRIRLIMRPWPWRLVAAGP